jgi:hypothetical protein
MICRRLRVSQATRLDNKMCIDQFREAPSRGRGGQVFNSENELETYSFHRPCVFRQR